MGSSTELGLSLRSPKTRIILLGPVIETEEGWKEAEYGSHVEEIDEKRWFKRNNIIS